MYLPIELKLSIVQFLPIHVVLQLDFITAIGLAKNDEKVRILVMTNVIKTGNFFALTCLVEHDMISDSKNAREPFRILDQASRCGNPREPRDLG